MGKRQVHAIAVRKPVTFALLLLTTSLMATLFYLLSGRAYAADRHPLWDLTVSLLGGGSAPISRGALLAFLMPVSAHALLFVPWGFLAFVGFDSPKRARKVAYLMTVAGAVVVAGAMAFWQEFLPTRVTSIPDILANGLGALIGAALGHMRKGVRFQFEI